MKIYNLKAAPVANVKELKDEKRPKAKQILLGADTHLRGYQVGRKVDHGAVGAVENFRSEEAFLLFVVKQLERAERVVVVYEAGPLGYSLYRKFKELSVECYVCAPDSSEQQKKRRKNNKIDARNLTSKLFNYVNGDQNAYRWSGCRVKRRNSCGWPVGNTINWSKSASAWVPRETRCS